MDCSGGIELYIQRLGLRLNCWDLTIEV